MQAAPARNATVLPAIAQDSAGAASLTMRAIVHRQYGLPHVLACEEIARPVSGAGEVLVQVHAAGANVGDHHIVTGKPYLIRLSPFGGLPGPKHRVPGATMSGRVEAVGPQVTTFRPGDEVFGQAAHGAYAEYVVVAASAIAPKPMGLSFEEAAAVPWGATALQAFRAGGLKAGQKVLINGASGGVGTWAVQIAHALGSEVTAVCNTRHVPLVRALGADEVVDYTAQDFVHGGARFDLMLDLIGNRSASDCRSVLVPTGVFVPCSGGGGDWLGPLARLVALLLTFLFASQKLKTFVMSPQQKDLLLLKELVEAGKAKPVIEHSYALSETAEALRHVGEGHSQGQTVIRIAR